MVGGLGANWCAPIPFFFRFQTIKDLRMRIQSLLLLISAFSGILFSTWLLLSYSTSAEVLRLDLLTATVGDLVKLLDAGTVTSEQLIKEYIARIDENNY